VCVRARAYITRFDDVLRPVWGRPRGRARHIPPVCIHHMTRHFVQFIVKASFLVYDDGPESREVWARGSFMGDFERSKVHQRATVIGVCRVLNAK